MSEDEYYNRGSWAHDKSCISFQEYVRRVVDQNRTEEYRILIKLYGAETIQAIYDGTQKFLGNPVLDMTKAAMGDTNGKS